ncbi:hypothetical protein TrVE_jg12007 [Triparma verrucosa]|uniref:Fibronectin type-III domain-containing protein n=1 Tax=Triparma verrucosa TaxID=1606542 RepID=A0A9W7KY92_9STRA|nr:hypothetical protein TrVE_jg12007 [Triparma verrucosa]
MAERARAAFSGVDAAGVGKVETIDIPLLLAALNQPLTVPMDELEAELDREGTGLIFESDFVNWVEKTALGPSIDDIYIGGDSSSASTNINDLNADQLFSKVTKVAAEARKTNSSDIHEAAWNGDLELVKRYISIDTSLANSVDDSEWGGGYRPLHYAAYQGYVEICKLLLDNATVDMNSTTSTGCTALFLSAQQGHPEVVRLLLLQGADPTIAEEEYHFTAVDVARSFKKTIFDPIFKNGEEWEYEKWKQVPSKLEPPKVSKAKGNSFEVELPSFSSDPESLAIRLFKLKIVSLPSGSITDLLIVPRSEWEGGEEESIIVRGLEPGCSYASYVSGVNGMGYGEYSEMSAVVTIKARKIAPPEKIVKPNTPPKKAEEEVKVASVQVKKSKKPKKSKKKQDKLTLQTISVHNTSSSSSKVSSQKQPTAQTLPQPRHQQPPGSRSSDESSELDFGALEPDVAVDIVEDEENEPNV